MVKFTQLNALISIANSVHDRDSQPIGSYANYPRTLLNTSPRPSPHRINP